MNDTGGRAIANGLPTSSRFRIRRRDQRVAGSMVLHGETGPDPVWREKCDVVELHDDS